MAEHPTPEHKQAPNPGYETSDAQVGPFVKAGILLSALIVLSIVGMVVLFKIFNFYQPMFDDPVPPLADLRQTVSVPSLQIDPPRQKQELRQQEDDLLNSYGWADLDSKRARIPIKRAIELMGEGKFAIDLSPRPLR